MTLEPGAKLGPYEITSRIGVGGMGEVWKARDPRLNRDVAIKTSLVGFGGRFQKPEYERPRPHHHRAELAGRAEEIEGWRDVIWKNAQGSEVQMVCQTLGAGSG